MAVIQIIVNASNQTAAGFSQVTAGLTAVTASTQRATLATTQQTTANRQLALLQLRVAAAQTDSAGRVRIYTDAMNQATRGSREFYQAQLNLIRAQERLNREQAQAARVVTTGAARGGVGLAGIAGIGGAALGGLGIGLGIGEITGQIRQLGAQGLDAQVAIDRTRGSLGALLGDQQRANDIIGRANAFGARYAMTQREIAEALQASSQILRTSQAPVESMMSVLARLQVLSPEQGLQGAALALRELSSGDTQSLVERFEVSRDAANAMKREIAGGADAVQVLGRYLETAGITDGTLTASLEGAAGAQREYNVQMENLGLAINDIATRGGVLRGVTTLISNTTDELERFQQMWQRAGQIGAGMAENPLVRLLNYAVDNNELQLALDRMVARFSPLEMGSAGRRGFRADASVTAPRILPPAARPPRFSGFGGTPRPPSSVGAGGRPNVTVNIYPQGVVHTARDLADYVRAATREDAFRNAIDVIGNQ